MKRELWLATQSFANGIKCLNSLFCYSETESEVSQQDITEVAQELAKLVTNMSLEDAKDIIQRAQSILTMNAMTMRKT